jgi:hypothetical protein
MCLANKQRRSTGGGGGSRLQQYVKPPGQQWVQQGQMTMLLQSAISSTNGWLALTLTVPLVLLQNGTVPLNRLLYKWKLVNAVKAPSVDGMVPVS